mmetsp:Transcript_23265/g.54139  ORF Transcript_23265/g.54139 Transcript_23265/m.54139 type:complete len:302 (-) Transcript_23265:195-1100(-)|eukprot:CAMPEP_0178428240 /NCGR_PEP_ID=MMETSP0689_2-20121128/30173_1 /TAXON_ID=160604 /ORGANISM="Amphidinium massartii, Strain CS-259" /LENGTH=301 /DNA_ID=CAMNT_0020050001 /DNA_START=77 /DNA_END=982 /DNA_ORIENTATION=+
MDDDSGMMSGIMSNEVMQEMCTTQMGTSQEALDFFLDHRAAFLLVTVTALNLGFDYIEKRVLPRFQAYKHMPPRTITDMTIRFMQLILGTWVGLSGYGFVAYSLITQCNVDVIFIFYVGGMWLFSMDLHEYIRHWPLRAPVLGHHVMVFFVMLVLLEFGGAANELDSGNILTLIMISNIGLMWVTDFYHVIYRVARHLDTIHRFRRAYLAAAVVRIATIGIFIGQSLVGFSRGNLAAGVVFALMCLAYVYNTYCAILFVWRFDVEKYFTSHQATWVEAGKTDPASEAASPKSAQLEKQIEV